MAMAWVGVASLVSHGLGGGGGSCAGRTLGPTARSRGPQQALPQHRLAGLTAARPTFSDSHRAPQAAHTPLTVPVSSSYSRDPKLHQSQASVSSEIPPTSEGTRTYVSQPRPPKEAGLPSTHPTQMPQFPPSSSVPWLNPHPRATPYPFPSCLGHCRVCPKPPCSTGAPPLTTGRNT